MMRKGQASVEMLVTFGLFITFMLPVLLLVLVASQYGAENSTVYQAQATSHLIADTINEVYTQGCPTEYSPDLQVGASRTILVNLPGNAQSLQITPNTDLPSGGEAIVTVGLSDGMSYAAVSPIFARVKAEFGAADSDFTDSVRGLKGLKIYCRYDTAGPLVVVEGE